MSARSRPRGVWRLESARAAGGVFLKFLPDAWSLLGQPLVSAHALFLAGAAARLCAAGFALRVDGRRGGRPADAPPGGGRACEAVGVSFDCQTCGACCCNTDRNRAEKFVDYVEVTPRSAWPVTRPCSAADGLERKKASAT